jgi:hypothetical protein
MKIFAKQQFLRNKILQHFAKICSFLLFVKMEKNDRIAPTIRLSMTLENMDTVS